MVKDLKINKHFPPLKKDHLYTLDRVDTHVTSYGLGQIDYSGQL